MPGRRHSVWGTIAVGSFSETSAAHVAPAPAPGGGPLLRPAQLPADISDFTGRETHVEHLCRVLVREDAGTNPGAVRIAVVAGTAGLGKTTLAVHAAHQVSASFPDGQLYVDLLGAGPQPAAPGEVLARFLRNPGPGQTGDMLVAVDAVKRHLAPAKPGRRSTKVRFWE